MWIIKLVSSIAYRVKKEKDKIQRAEQFRIDYKLFINFFRKRLNYLFESNRSRN